MWRTTTAVWRAATEGRGVGSGPEEKKPRHQIERDEFHDATLV
jgi:hypothetical protein